MRQRDETYSLDAHNARAVVQRVVYNVTGHGGYEIHGDFEWGVQSAGSSLLALEILLDYYNSEKKAVDYFLDFRNLLVAMLPAEGFRITGDDIKNIIAAIPLRVKAEAK